MGVLAITATIDEQFFYYIMSVLGIFSSKESLFQKNTLTPCEKNMPMKRNACPPLIYDGHPVPLLEVLIWAPEESLHHLDLLQPGPGACQKKSWIDQKMLQKLTFLALFGFSVQKMAKSANTS